MRGLLHGESGLQARLGDEIIYKSLIFGDDIHEIHGEDLFRGKLGLTDYQFSEIQIVLESESTDSDGHTTKTKIQAFKGIVFVADFHKNFNGMTVLSSKNAISRSLAGRLAGRLLRPLVFRLTLSKSDRARKEIKLESDAFNEAFNTRTSDEIEARYILTSSMMERILAFRDRSKGRIEISFVDSCMYIAIASGKNYFETDVKNPVDGPKLEELYNDLTFFFGLIEGFDLNTRIWNKD
ncbi:DUF3137 domain-containing protein [Paenibacillaceae bacterium]|nr:DUF3137 domain-containing protein [Paenibacillaceae bacterium]